MKSDRPEGKGLSNNKANLGGGKKKGQGFGGAKGCKGTTITNNRKKKGLFWELFACKI